MTSENRRRGRPRQSAAHAQQPSIQALDRAIDVLAVVAAHDGVTLSQIASELGQSVATMHRVINSLEQRAMIELSRDSQEWHIGPEAFRLGSAFLRRSNVIERSRPVMRQLTAEMGETSNLGIEWEGNVLFVSQIETHQFIRAFFRPGTVSPFHASGIGKALLSMYDLPRTRAVLQQSGFEAFTANTILTADALLVELDIIRRKGFAVDNEERAKGMRCIAAPILNGFGEPVAGLSISGPTERLPDAHIDTIGGKVKEAAQQISSLLGLLKG